MVVWVRGRGLVRIDGAEGAKRFSGARTPTGIDRLQDERGTLRISEAHRRAHRMVGGWSPCPGTRRGRCGEEGPGVSCALGLRHRKASMKRERHREPPTGGETAGLAFRVHPFPQSPTSENKVCCRLRPPAAASDPTGHEQREEQNSVAWLRIVKNFSNRVLAGSATAKTLTDSSRPESWTFHQRE